MGAALARGQITPVPALPPLFAAPVGNTGLRANLPAGASPWP